MKIRYALFTTGFLILLTAGCVTRMVTYEGRRMPSSKAIAIIRQKAEQSLAADDYQAAIGLYASMANVDPLSDDAPAGLLKAGDIAFGRQFYREAAFYYNKTVMNYPGSAQTVDAKLGLAVIDLHGESYTTAQEILTSIASATSGGKKGKVYFYLGEAYYRTGAYESSFDAFARSIVLLPRGRERDVTGQILKKLVNEKLTDAAMQRLEGGDYDLHDLSLLRLKLAGDAYTAGDYKESLTMVDRIIASGVASPGIMNAATSLKATLTSITQVNITDIGCILPLSGEFAPYGQQALNGIELALGVFGKQPGPYKLVVMDSKGITDVAMQEAEMLVKNYHVAAVIGPLLNGTAAAVAVTLQRYQVPDIYLSPRSGITMTGNFIFQDSLTPQDQARNIVDYAVKALGITTFAVLYPENNYGQALAGAFTEDVLARGGTVSYAEGYDPSETDFKSQIEAIGGTFSLKPGANVTSATVDFSAVFIPDYYEKVAMIAPQLLYYNINNVQLLGANGWSGQGLIDMGGRYVDGAIYTDGFFTQSTNPVTRAFIDAYTGQFHEEPTVLSGLGYDAADIMTAAIGKAADRVHIRDNLLGINSFDGVTGVTSYNGGRVPVKELYLLKVRGRRIVELPH